jgi:hypothetical protein
MEKIQKPVEHGTPIVILSYMYRQVKTVYKFLTLIKNQLPFNLN